MSGDFSDCIGAILKLIIVSENIKQLHAMKMEHLRDYAGDVAKGYHVSDSFWKDVNAEEAVLWELNNEYKKEVEDGCGINWSKINTDVSEDFIPAAEEAGAFPGVHVPDDEDMIDISATIKDPDIFLDWIKRQGVHK